MENENVMYHIGINKETIEGAKFAILPGDPKRVELIAKKLKNYKYLGTSREYTSYLGEINNNKVLVISTGMGGPSTAICVEELNEIGIKYLIRVGTCGGMQLNVNAGDIVIANASIRQEGTSKEYVPVEFPAVGDFNVISALKEAAEVLGYKYHIGVVQCKDSFYGQHEPDRMPVGYELKDEWNAWIKAGALASEMETSALYIVSTTLRLKAGAVLSVIWNQERENAGLDNETDLNVDKEIDIAIKAIEILMR